MDTKFLGWFFASGSVALPKRFLAYMEPLGISFEELGQLVYLLSLEGAVKKQDSLGQQAAQSLVQRRFISFNVETGQVDFSPLFDKMLTNTTATIEADAKGSARKETTAEAVAAIVKRFEKKLMILLPVSAQKELAEAMLRYGWNSELMYELYQYYYKEKRRHYSFPSLAQQAYNAGVNDKESLGRFIKTLDFELQKVREVLKLLGKSNNPTEPQRKLYSKWSREWGFPHELILMALDDTVGADNPSMNYVDAILAQWRGAQVKTPADVENYRTHYKSQRQQNSGSKRYKNRYVSSEGYRDFSDREE